MHDISSKDSKEYFIFIELKQLLHDMYCFYLTISFHIQKNAQLVKVPQSSRSFPIFNMELKSSGMEQGISSIKIVNSTRNISIVCIPLINNKLCSSNQKKDNLGM